MAGSQPIASRKQNSMYTTDRQREESKAYLDRLRDDSGKLPAYAWPGGYQIIYLTHSSDVICPDCANGDYGSEFDDPIVVHDIYWEGPTIQCDNCQADIESAYGDPEEEETA